MDSFFKSKEKIGLAALLGLSFVFLFFGWKLFWFLTDDAFIAFRYVSNSVLGHGYVWNPPPFKPVEGYTSFLWILLLDGVWRLFGVAPPASANVLSLVFSVLTLSLVAVWVMRLPWSSRLKKGRVLWLGFALAGILANRTFLTWTSSGLETAMFNFFFTLWLYCALRLPAGSPRWAFGLSGSTVLLYLTRPDGLLVLVATVILMAVVWLDQKRPSGGFIREGAGALPLVLIPLHLIWRKAVYGEWLPNTYYAKTVAGRIWPESGIRYAASFILEYALWIWAAVLIVLLIQITRKRKGRRKPAGSLPSQKPNRFVPWVVLSTVAAHVLYYTVVVGGDHFEFRVYSHLVPLAFVSFLWMLNRLSASPLLVALLSAALILCSCVIPWPHWYLCRHYKTRQETGFLKVPVAGWIESKLPARLPLVGGVLRFYDRQQAWLISHMVCTRYQEHKTFYLHLIQVMPSREQGMAMPSDGFPVITTGYAGVLSWVLPKANVIDLLGLNDYVVARNPTSDVPIAMAHERRPPPGYVECFAPNVAIQDKRIVVRPRTVPLVADSIVSCERRYIGEQKK